MATFQDMIINALMELQAYGPGEAPSGADIQTGLSVLGRVGDQWNAREDKSFNRNFVNYILTPSHQPHLIGPGLSAPDFATPAGAGGGSGITPRPNKIYTAALILNNVNPNVTRPMRVHNGNAGDQWWAAQRIKALANNIPTDLYYSPDFPNGSLYLWPIPTVAYGLELELRNKLSQVLLSDTVNLPDGYEQALTLTTAEEMTSIFPVSGRDDSKLARRAAKARWIIESANTASPQTSSEPYKGSRRGGSDFNYTTGGLN